MSPSIAAGRHPPLPLAPQVHHSSPDYNLSTALRQGTGEVFVSWAFYLPLALVVPPEASALLPARLPNPGNALQGTGVVWAAPPPPL